MTSKQVLNSVLPAIGKTQAEAAAELGWTPQQISQKISRDSLKVSDLLKLLEANGVEIVFRNKKTGELIETRIPGHGRRVKGMSDGVRYDTAASNALSNSFFADGVNEYDENGEAQELYVDLSGRYFFAEYSPKGSRVRAVPASIAAAFIEKYGTDIEKKKK